MLGSTWLSFSFCQEQGDTRPQITIERKDKTIRVIQNGTRADGARTILLNPKCDEEIRLSTFFAPTPAFVETLVNETRIVSSIAFIKKPEKKEEKEPEPEPESEVESDIEESVMESGLESESEVNLSPEEDIALDQSIESNGEESNSVPEEDGEADSELEGEEETLEMFGGTLDFTDSTRCPENVQATTTADVTVEEGRSTITGSKFLYDNATGVGNMEGPVNLEREAEGDSPALSGNSDNMDFNVDEDLTILKGNVTIESDGRVSEADTVEFDEQASLAILLGNPAKSSKDGDLVQGNIITYYLDSNDVVVGQNIQASFELDP